MRKSMDFEKMIGRGELGAPDAPDGFQAQTPNGTARWRGTGWNKSGRGGWAANDCCWGDGAEVEPDATRPAGRSNRTGE